MEKKQPQQQVFMINEVDSQGQRYAMDHFYTVSKSHAEQMASEGKAIQYNNDVGLDNYDKTITKEVESFRKAYDKLKNSKDPRYKDQDFFRDEVGKLKKELDAKVSELQSEYSTVVKDIQNEAHKERANLTRNITPSDEKGAGQLMNELVSDAKLNGIDGAIGRIESDMKYFSEGRKAALANELHRLVDVAGDDTSVKRQLRALSNSLRQDSEGVELAARMANALPTSTGTAYNTLKLIHPEYKRR